MTRKSFKPVKSPLNSTLPYFNEIRLHFIHELKNEGYFVIGVKVFRFKLIRFYFKIEA